MPVQYSKEKQGWFVVDATDEEMEQIIELGTQELMRRIALMAAERWTMQQVQDEANDVTVN